MNTTHYMKAAVQGTIKQAQADGLVGSDAELKEAAKQINVTVSEGICFRSRSVIDPFALQMLGHLHNKGWGRDAFFGDILARDLDNDTCRS